MTELAKLAGIVKGIKPIPLLEVGYEAALEDFADPEHISKAGSIQGMSGQCFVVRWLHPRRPTPQPDKSHRPLVRVVGMGPQREPSFAGIGCN
jgi:hypothetical protein